jgi:anaerobic ribonucleoside-triphosphate reductase activating protein
MRLAGTEYNLINKTFDIFVSGCNRKCQGCFNPEAQDFSFGEEINYQSIKNKIWDNNKLIRAIRIMGGDLLCQSETDAILFSLSLKGHFYSTELHLYTGSNKEDIPDWCYVVFDRIKYGPFIESLKCENRPYGSLNQGIVVKGQYGLWHELDTP